MNGSSDATTTAGTSPETSTANNDNGTFFQHPVLFFSLFLGTAFVLISVIGILVYNKMTKKLSKDSSDSDLITSVTYESVENCEEDGSINVSASAQNASQPAATRFLPTEELNETEPEYDYPELFRFRMQLDIGNRQRRGQEPKQCPIHSPKSKVVPYVNVGLNGQTEDDDCQYLTPRQYSPRDDSEDGISVEETQRHPENPAQDCSNSDYENVPEIDVETESGHGYVKVKSDVTVPWMREKLQRANVPQQNIIEELQRHFQKPVKTSSPAKQEVNGEKGTDMGKHRVHDPAVDATKGSSPTKKFIKRRYENIPD